MVELISGIMILPQLKKDFFKKIHFILFQIFMYLERSMIYIYAVWESSSSLHWPMQLFCLPKIKKKSEELIIIIIIIKGPSK
jgi:hypothetical protein